MSEIRTRPRLGRPPLPREKARPNRLVTFLTDEELEGLRRQAKREGPSLSAKAHQLLSHSLQTRADLHLEPRARADSSAD
ncbi:MAG: hypothetical protein WBQ30_19225 [Thermoanaerobaculia bacterium]